MARSVIKVRRNKASRKLKELYDNPAVKYIAAGIAATAVGKILDTISKRYPEITKWITDEMDSVEEKLVEFRKLHKGEHNLQH